MVLTLIDLKYCAMQIMRILLVDVERVIWLIAELMNYVAA